MTDGQMNIQWYPGHMAKTRRQIESDLKQIDAVCELVDARIPYASRNPDIDALCGAKPRVLVLNRTDLADADATARWASYFRSRGETVVCTDCKSRRGIPELTASLKEICSDKIAHNAARGMRRPLRLMVVGIPNVGKSTLINQISGRKGTKTENRPGVTRGRQWVVVDAGLQLLDTPGILWPKFSDPNVGLLLACTGAVKEDVFDREELACRLAELLWKRYPDVLRTRYGVLPPPQSSISPGYDLLLDAGRRRGCLLARGEIDTARMAKILLDEYRSGKLGRFTLEQPEGIK